jgi:hypothetical protein
MSFQRNGSLVCDTPDCKALIDVPGPQVEVIAKARAKGWHCYRGPNFTNTEEQDVYICDRCMASPRPKLDPVEVLKSQDPLF